MREIDTETPVIWPSWCYSGEASATNGDDSPPGAHQTSSAISLSLKTAAINCNKNNAKRKRSLMHSHIDKMLSDRMNLTDNKKFCDINASAAVAATAAINNSSASLIYDKFKSAESAMDFFKSGNGDVMNVVNNNNSISNNNSIKSERLSPPQQHQTNGNANGDAQSLNSRSRSATPSSYPGTPPQNSMDALNSSFQSAVGTAISASALQSGQIKSSDFQPRNYSDFIRSLAAKYNNSNPNESNNSRSSFFESRFGINSMKAAAAAAAASTKDSPSPPENVSKRSTQSTIAPQVPNANSLMSTIFPGISFPPTVFPPLIDMSSTQALVTLARAAKEAELHQILKGPAKRSNVIATALQNSPSGSQNSNHLQQQSPSRLGAQSAASNLSYMQKSPLSRIPLASNLSVNDHPHLNNQLRGRAASPLDLSASTPASKRLKLESPSPGRSVGSPPANQNQTTTPQPQPSRTQSNASSSPGPMNHTQRRCHAQSDEINAWSVSQVCDFVSSIDICAEYVDNFREQCIDGSGLPLLTEDHLMNSLGMKLGPALKLRSVLLKKIGGPCPCVSCTNFTSSSSLSSANCSGLSVPNTADSPTEHTTRPASVDSGT